MRTERTIGIPALSNTQRASQAECDFQHVLVRGDRARLKRVGTRAETRLRLSVKRTSPFKLAGEGVSVQSTTGSRGVRISSSNGSNAGYTMF